MKCKKNYYDILGVTPDSDNDEVKTSYRTLARKYHPDINKEAGSTDKFKDILEAYETLSDETKRKQYDMVNGFYKTPKNHFKNETSYKTEPNKDSFEKDGSQNKQDINQKANKRDTTEFKNKKENNETLNNTYFKDKVNSILDEISKNHNTNKHQKHSPKNGDDINTNITISLEEAIQGAERQVNILHKECCPHCKGRKFINNSKCPKCNGTGIYELNRKITVKIPAGIKNNTKLRLKNEGNPGFFGGKSGDLYICVKINQNETIIDGNDIICKVPISPFEAVLGGTISINSVNGNIQLTIPPLTQSGQKFQISNKGLKTNGNVGDMIIIVEIQIPKSLSEEEKSLYGKLKKVSTKNIREN